MLPSFFLQLRALLFHCRFPFYVLIVAFNWEEVISKNVISKQIALFFQLTLWVKCQRLSFSFFISVQTVTESLSDYTSSHNLSAHFCFTLVNLKNTNSPFLCRVSEEKITFLFPHTVLQTNIFRWVCFLELRHLPTSYISSKLLLIITIWPLLYVFLFSQIRRVALSHCY